MIKGIKGIKGWLLYCLLPFLIIFPYLNFVVIKYNTSSYPFYIRFLVMSPLTLVLIIFLYEVLVVPHLKQKDENPSRPDKKNKKN